SPRTGRDTLLERGGIHYGAAFRKRRLRAGGRVLRRQSHDDIEPGRQFADARALDGSPGYDHRVPGGRVTNTVQDAVGAVLRLALDEELSSQLGASGNVDDHVNVTGAPRVQPRLDGAEQILAG